MMISLFLYLFPILILFSVPASSVQYPTSASWSTTGIPWPSYLPDGSFGGNAYASCSSSPLSPYIPVVNLAYGGGREWNNNYGAINDLLFSETSTNITLLPPTPSAYINGGMAYLASGSILIFGGFGASGGPVNDVNWSPDMGVNWYGYYDMPYFQYQAVAPWAPRYGFGYTTVPNTNMVFITGGAGHVNTNDIWMTNDGATSTDVYQPPVWTLVNPAGPLTSYQVGVGLVAMYDKMLILAGGQNGYVDSPYPFTNHVFLSADLGVTWTAYTYRPWTARFYHDLLADTDNILYLLNGIVNPSQAIQDLWISSDHGYTWNNVPVVHPLNYIQYACVGLSYVYSPPNPRTGAVTILSKSLYSWGGRDAVSQSYAGIFLATFNLTGTPSILSPPLSPISSSSSSAAAPVGSYNSSFFQPISAGAAISPPPLSPVSPVTPSSSTTVLLSYPSLFVSNSTSSKGAGATGLNLGPLFNPVPFGGPTQTICITLWVYPTALPTSNTYSTSTWLLWLENNADSIQLLYQADGTLDFLVTNGVNGFYSFTSAPISIPFVNQWYHIQVTSVPVSSNSLLAVHTIQVNNVTIAVNANGRYPAYLTRNTTSFGYAPFSLFPNQFPFVGQMTDLLITAH